MNVYTFSGLKRVICDDKEIVDRLEVYPETVVSMSCIRCIKNRRRGILMGFLMKRTKNRQKLE